MNEYASEPTDQIASDPVPDEPAAEPPAGQSEQPTGLGLLLRKAREARGLTIVDVVAALKYSPRQIEALEADQLDLLPGSVFMRGMVRSYARFLKLDPVPLLALLEADAVVTADVRPPEDMGVAMPRSEARQLSAVAAGGILIGVVVAAVGVWHLLAPGPEPVATPAEQTVAEPVVVQPPVAESPIAAPAVETLATPTVAGPAAAPGSVREAAPAVAAITTVNAPEQSGENASPTLAANGKQLLFDFHGASWVEVKDASQRVVFTGQYASGARQAASGRPPFQLVIGNAPNVELKYEGRSVDLKPYTRADVARLTLE